MKLVSYLKLFFEIIFIPFLFFRLSATDDDPADFSLSKKNKGKNSKITKSVSDIGEKIFFLSVLFYRGMLLFLLKRF